jgi:hypothetical protein
MSILMRLAAGPAPHRRTKALFSVLLVCSLIKLSVLRFNNANTLTTKQAPPPPPSSQSQSQSPPSSKITTEPMVVDVDTSDWPVWWSVARHDRSGAVIHDMLRAHAYAFSHNVTYGGACICCAYQDKKKKAQERKPAVEELITNVGWGTTALRYGCPPQPFSADSPYLIYDDQYRDGNTKKRWNSRWKNYLWSQFSMDSKNNNASIGNYLEPDESSNPQYLQEKKKDKVFTIAVHIRRGDVTPCKLHFRYLPNAHYLRLIERFRTELLLSEEEESSSSTSISQQQQQQMVQVYIYSQNKSFEALLPDFANTTLHLDTDLADVWTGLLAADVMILSRSSFSYVPALISRPSTTHVVYTQFWDPPLPGWTVITNTSAEETEALKNNGSCQKKKKKKNNKDKTNSAA